MRKSKLLDTQTHLHGRSCRRRTRSNQSSSEICSGRHTFWEARIWPGARRRSHCHAGPATYALCRHVGKWYGVRTNVTLCGIPPWEQFGFIGLFELRFDSLCFAALPPHIKASLISGGVNDLSLGAIRKVKCEIINRFIRGMRVCALYRQLGTLWQYTTYAINLGHGLVCDLWPLHTRE